jgi:hypothetical protein
MTDDKKCSNGCGKQGTIGKTIGFDNVEWWCEKCACEWCHGTNWQNWHQTEKGRDELYMVDEDCKDPKKFKCKCGQWWLIIRIRW